MIVDQNSEETEFLKIVSQILKAPARSDRTGVGTHSLFGAQLEFSLADQFPLLTTRKITLRLVFEELMWFLRGQTDVKILQSKGVFVWNGNSNRAFLDKVGLAHFPEWEVGKSYGYQMRRFGGNAETGDQLKTVIDLLLHDPTSRRILINLWNPAELNEMALPPCLFCYQFYVQNGKLSVKLTQRSSDILLAGGWNIATGALLVYLLCSVTGLTPDRLIWSIGDAHIYANQVEGACEQLLQTPAPFPQLQIARCAQSSTEDALREMLSVEWNDISLRNYHPCKKIKFVLNP